MDNNIFRIHKGAAGAALTAWQPSTYITGDLINTIPDTLVDGAVLRKMGTSIPSPFARIFLFEAAFKMIQNAHNGNSSYHQLVSECLDMLEFIFLRSKDPLLTIRKWDKRVELAKLENNNIQEHVNLASVLGDAFNTVLPNVDVIYLFFYDEILMGGTSPLTMVFTSANWIRKSRENAFNFTGGIAGVNLFEGRSVPLHQRSESFRIFMHKFRLAYNQNLHEQAGSFWEYLNSEYNQYDVTIRNMFVRERWQAVYTNRDFLTEYNQLCMPDDTLVMSNNLPISGGDIEVNGQSGYIIRPTVGYYANYIYNGMPITIDPPMVLTDAGLPNVAYIGGQPWSANTCTLNRVPSTPLHQRELPGGAGIIYPYLTDADFLQEKMVKVNYVINKDKFETCTDGESHYLLPVKKEYFNYFTLEDLRNQLHLRLEDDRVIVELKIPIQDATYPTITLRKIYDALSIDNYAGGGRYFNVGIAPFYKIVDNLPANSYYVMLGDTSNSIRLSFGLFDQIGTFINVAAPKERTVGVTKYFQIENTSFDFIEVDCNDSKGMLIPKMQKISMANANRDYLFGIDFGTTNTHISYSVDNGAHATSFTIQPNDIQTVYLNQGDYGHPLFAELTEREFLPTLIGANNASVAFPYRTVVCETANFRAEQPILFGNVSLGFHMLQERLEVNGVSYRTDLKWALEGGAVNEPINILENRVKLYCRQILFMIKNKIVLNDGHLKPTIILTFPGTMSRVLKNQYLHFWEEEAGRIFGNGNVDIMDASESIVPYYSFICKDINAASDVVNVDVGGGTTDILYIYPRRGLCYYSSSLFAANDLWGDGIGNIVNQRDNGFVKLMDAALNDNRILLHDQNLRSCYETTKIIAQSSADIISFLFKYDNEFKLSELIVRNNRLYPLIFIHFASLLYHIGQTLEKLDAELPAFLTFTGMGSKYIKLISPRENDIRDLAKCFIETFTGKQVPQLFAVKFADNPKEITAEGALASMHRAVPQINPNLIKVYGFENAAEEYEFGQVCELENQVCGAFEKFLDKMADRRIKDYLLTQYDVRIDAQMIDTIKRYVSQSYQIMASRRFTPDTPVNETLFFWPLKQVLYELSKLGNNEGVQ